MDAHSSSESKKANEPITALKEEIKPYILPSGLISPSKKANELITAPLTLREEIKPYILPSGLISPREGHKSGNGIRYFSEYYLTLYYRGELTGDDRWEFKRVILSCMDKESNTVRRFPEHKGQNSWEDYSALMHACQKIWPVGAVYIFNWGKKNFWFFKNERSKWTLKNIGAACFFRMPHLIAHFYHCVEKKAPWYLRLFWIWNIQSQMKKPKVGPDRDEDGWTHSWHFTKAVSVNGDHLRSAGMTKAAVDWYVKLMETEPRRIGTIMNNYFALGKWHPVAKWFPD